MQKKQRDIAFQKWKNFNEQKAKSKLLQKNKTQAPAPIVPKKEAPTPTDTPNEPIV
jgi:hypothetical protein